MSRQTHVVSTAEGLQLSLDQYGQGTHEAAVIICPGFFQSKDTPTFQRLARTLATEHDILAMDFRGHGRSSGRYTFSAREGADLDAVLDLAKARYQRIGILAFSLGAAITINAVSRHPNQVHSVIAVSAPCAFEEIDFKWWTPEAMRTGLDGLEPGVGCRPGPLWLSKPKPLACVERLAPTPILFIHGTRDATVGVEHSRRLYAAAAEPKQLELIEGGSHAEALFRDDPQRFCQIIETWWAGTLQHHGT